MSKEIKMNELVWNLIVLRNADSFVVVVQGLQLVACFFLLETFFIVAFYLSTLTLVDVLLYEFINFLAELLVSFFNLGSIV